MPIRPDIALVLDPRFSGGTSAAVAHEILALHRDCDLSVSFIESAMFPPGRRVNARIEAALNETGIIAAWNPKLVRAETVVLHNPSFLKFDKILPVRFNCARAIIVSHENFLRPDGTPGFDVAHCLRLIDRQLPPCPRLIAPVSRYNRRGVATWLADNSPDFDAWHLAPIDWFNVCDFALHPPTDTPRDRRGRVSRAGFEKFPPKPIMLTHFPAHADRCAILGGDSFLLPGDQPPAHWEIVPFGGASVEAFLAEIDFFVYFTHPNWRESFGRVIAEAIASGKVVITDPGTAESFGDGVIASDGTDIDAIVSRFCADPAGYRSFVTAAQRKLANFTPQAFRTAICSFLDSQREGLTP